MKHKLIGKNKVCLECIKESEKLNEELGIVTIWNGDCKHFEEEKK